MSELYDVSDGLFALRRDFLEHETGGLSMDGEAVHHLNVRLLRWAQLAQSFAHEIARHRWNGRARTERQAEDRMLEELARSNTNVVLLHHAREDEQGGAA